MHVTQPPRLLDGDDQQAPLTMFLDPRGRITRRRFWLHGVLTLGALGVFLRALLDIARLQAEHAELAVNLLMLWPAIVISAKRWHDRDRSAWWVAVALIPLVGLLWLLIDNGFRRGTPGPNRFGPEPG